MALVAGLVPVAYERMREASQYRDAVRSMFNQLRAARAFAGNEGREIRFVVDLSRRTYGIEDADLKVLPEPW